MTEFKALFKESQHSPHREDAVLFVNTAATAEMLMEAAEHRGNAAIGLLQALTFSDSSDIVAIKHSEIALGVLLLTSDAMSLYGMAYEKIGEVAT